MKFVQWLTGLHQHMKPEDRLYFGDAVHFKHNAETGFAWSEVGEPHQIPANTGRQRYNVLGAYCIQTHEHLFILTSDNIKQEKLVEFLALLRAKHPERRQCSLSSRPKRPSRRPSTADQIGVSAALLPQFEPD